MVKQAFFQEGSSMLFKFFPQCMEDGQMKISLANL